MVHTDNPIFYHKVLICTAYTPLYMLMLVKYIWRVKLYDSYSINKHFNIFRGYLILWEMANMGNSISGQQLTHTCNQKWKFPQGKRMNYFVTISVCENLTCTMLSTYCYSQGYLYVIVFVQCFSVHSLRNLERIGGLLNQNIRNLIHTHHPEVGRWHPLKSSLSFMSLFSTFPLAGEFFITSFTPVLPSFLYSMHINKINLPTDRLFVSTILLL